MRLPSGENTSPVKLTWPSLSGWRMWSETVLGAGVSSFSEGSGTRWRIRPEPGSSTTSSGVLPAVTSSFPLGLSASAWGRMPGSSICNPAGVSTWLAGL